MLSVSDSKVVNADRQAGALAEQSSPSVAFEEVLKVVTCAVAKLSSEWPDEKRQVNRSKLNNRYLTSGREQPPIRHRSFLPYLLTEVSMSWRNPYSE